MVRPLFGVIKLNHLVINDRMFSSPPIWCVFLEAGPPAPEDLKIRLAAAEQKFKESRDVSGGRWAKALARASTG
jgi:hypothetical protein